MKSLYLQNTRNHAKIHVHLVEKGIFHFQNGWDLFCIEESDGQSIELHSHILQNIDYGSLDVNPSRTMPRREAERGARWLVRRMALKWWMLVETGTAIPAPCLCVANGMIYLNPYSSEPVMIVAQIQVQG